MKLNIGERFAILNLLPREASFANLKILRKLKEDLSFSEKEWREYGFEEAPNGGLRWKPEIANATKEVVVGEVANQMIVKKLKELNGQDKVPDDCFTIYEKFVKEDG